jgi:hypothetical protein
VTDHRKQRARHALLGGDPWLAVWVAAAVFGYVLLLLVVVKALIQVLGHGH